MHDSLKRRVHRSPIDRPTSQSTRQDKIWIKRRRYTVMEELGFGHRPRFLVFDSGSRCRRLIMRLPNDEATRQHLRVLRRLPSTNAVPQIIDLQNHRDECLVVLSWTDGLDLGKYLDQVKSGRVVAPSAFESLRLVRGLAHGLRQLHQHAQLIHGDLKPENLILTRKPAFLAMIDYGSAWQIERAAFRHQGDGTSPLYAAPELLTNGNAGDFRSDQFSVSVMLYQLLTGVIPYHGLGGQAGLKRFRDRFENEPTPPSQTSQAMNRLPKLLTRELDRVVLKGMRLKAESRYPTTSAWLDAIETLFLKFKLWQMPRDPSRWERFVDWLANFVHPFT